MKLWVERNQGSVCSNIEENYSTVHDFYIKEDETKRDKRYIWACKLLTVVKTFMYIKIKSWCNAIIIKQSTQLKNQWAKDFHRHFLKGEIQTSNKHAPPRQSLGKCNPNHKEIPLPVHWTAMRRQPRKGKQQVLSRMWRNGHPNPLSVGMETVQPL